MDKHIYMSKYTLNIIYISLFNRYDGNIDHLFVFREAKSSSEPELQ